MEFKIGLCQMKGSSQKEESLKKAAAMVREAAEAGAQMVALPEMWNCPYANEYFRAYGETEDGPTVRAMSALAAELGIYLIGGSIPELADGEGPDAKVYNSCFVFDRSGRVIARHRKAHLFDIDVPGGIRFTESETLTAGDKATVFDTAYCRVGVAICYDVRFPELFRKMTLEGAKLIVLPSAFNLTTGPAHWDLSMRARALDNQVYFAAISPARDMEAPYQAYGSSCVVDPWGQFVVKTDEKESIIYADIDLERVEAVRGQLPLLKHRRPELY